MWFVSACFTAASRPQHNAVDLTTKKWRRFYSGNIKRLDPSRNYSIFSCTDLHSPRNYCY